MISDASMDSPASSKGGETAGLTSKPQQRGSAFKQQRWEAFVPHGARWDMAPRVLGTDPCSAITSSKNTEARHQALFGTTFGGTAPSPPPMMEPGRQQSTEVASQTSARSRSMVSLRASEGH